MDAKQLADMIGKDPFEKWLTPENGALIRAALYAYAAATEIQGDDEVMRYVTSGNSCPVTRCTVSADLIRQLVAGRTATPEARDTVTVPRSLAERTEAMFRSVDPEGGIAQEWRVCVRPQLTQESK